MSKLSAQITEESTRLLTFEITALPKGLLENSLAPPYTPQRNGIAERRNRSLLDITRCLLMDKSLPAHLWGEAVKAAGDLLNLGSTKRHPDKTPQELFSGKKPSISHLKFFGSPVFVHTTKPSRSKLDPRSEKCVLLSFDTKAKAYRCYRPSTKRVFVSRDVTVDETSPNTQTPFSELKEDDPPTTIAAPTRKEEQATMFDQAHTPTPNTYTEPAEPVDHTEPTYAPLDTPSSPTESADIDQPESHQEIEIPPSLVPAPEPLRRSDRLRRFPRHLQDFAAHVQLQTTHSPDGLSEDATKFLTFQQAQTNPHWQSAMEAEIDSIHKNQTWTLVSLPPNTKAISSKWVYKLKPGTRGNPARYKARLVARGFDQRDGIDCLETFAPVVRWETIRILVALVVHLGWPIHQLNVLTAFLHGILKEDVYMQQPLGFVKLGFEHLVYKLHPITLWPQAESKGLVCPATRCSARLEPYTI